MCVTEGEMGGMDGHSAKDEMGGKKEGMFMDERGEEKGIEFPVPFPLLLPERSPMRRSAPPQRIPVHRKCKPSLSGDLFTKKKEKKGHGGMFCSYTHDEQACLLTSLHPSLSPILLQY